MTDLRHATALDRHRADGLPTIAYIQPPAWTEQAVCASTDPDCFFPEKGASTRDAKAICAGCPVKQECLDYADEIGDQYGIYGGLTSRERRRRRQQAAA